jgi:cytochrome b561/polyisoprenoid-binding protein YceI
MRPSRYSAVAIALHWLIALCIISMIPMGVWMAEAINDPEQQALAYRVFQIHKSVGFLILALTVLRIVWRLTHPVPALPRQMKGWEQFAARATHAAFYGLMLAMPLTGWAYVSTGWAVVSDAPLAVATSWFGLFTVPHLGFIEQAAEATRRAIAYSTMGAHALMAKGAAVLILLHIGAALKHQFINRDGVLSHMVPVLPHGEGAVVDEPRAMTKWLERGAGLGLILILAVAGAIAAKPAPLDAGQGGAAVASASVAVDAAAVAPGTATAWTVDSAQSSIFFSATHAGTAFEGQFGDWQAQVWFDPADLAGSKAVVTIKTSAAKTGDATKDGSITAAEWFNTAAYPTARFEASEFKALGGNRYEARGTLRIKAVSLPVVLPFTYDRNGDQAVVKGQVELDRTAFDLGMASDAAGAWVSKAVNVTIRVTAAAQS